MLKIFGLTLALLLGMMMLQACTPEASETESDEPVVNVLEPRTTIESTLQRAKVQLDQLEDHLERTGAEADTALQRTALQLAEDYEELEAELRQIEMNTGESATVARNEIRSDLDDLEVALTEARFRAAQTSDDLVAVIREQLDQSAAEIDSLEMDLDSTVTVDAVERDALKRAQTSFDTLSVYFTDFESASEETAADMLGALARAATDLERKLREAEVAMSE